MPNINHLKRKAPDLKDENEADSKKSIQKEFISINYPHKNIKSYSNQQVNRTKPASVNLNKILCVVCFQVPSKNLASDMVEVWQCPKAHFLCCKCRHRFLSSSNQSQCQICALVLTWSNTTRNAQAEAQLNSPFPEEPGQSGQSNEKQRVGQETGFSSTESEADINLRLSTDLYCKLNFVSYPRSTSVFHAQPPSCL